MLARPESHLQRPLRRLTQLRLDAAAAANNAAEAAENKSAGGGGSTKAEEALPRGASASLSATASLASTSDFNGNRYWPPVRAAHDHGGVANYDGGDTSKRTPTAFATVRATSSCRATWWRARTSCGTSRPIRGSRPRRRRRRANATDRGLSFVTLRDGSAAARRLAAYRGARGIVDHRRQLKGESSSGSGGGAGAAAVVLVVVVLGCEAERGEDGTGAGSGAECLRCDLTAAPRHDVRRRGRALRAAARPRHGARGDARARPGGRLPGPRGAQQQQPRRRPRRHR